MSVLRKNKNLSVCDLFAVLIGLALFALYFYRVKFGVGLLDETLYASIARRFADGARPLIDEWHITQLSDIFLVPPVLIYQKLTGGTDGVLLFLRQFFVVVNTFMFFVLYGRLRRYGVWGLLATAAFGAYVPHAMFTLNYYSMTVHTLMLVMILLFIKGRDQQERSTSIIALLFAGVILSAAVVIQPILAFLYFFYTVAVFASVLRKKRKPASEPPFSFFLNMRCWLILTASVLACAVLFLVYLQVKSGIVEIIQNIPKLFEDPYHTLTADSFWGYLRDRLLQLFGVFGTVNCIALIVFCAVVLLLHFKRMLHRNKYLWLSVNIALLLSCFLFPFFTGIKTGRAGWHHWFYFTVLPFPFYSFGIVNYLLCEKKDQRLLFGWLFVLLASLLVDLSSTATLGTYGILAAVPGILWFGQLLQEGKQDHLTNPSMKGKKKKAAGLLRKQTQINRIAIRFSKIAFTAFFLLVAFNGYLQAGLLHYEELDAERLPLNVIFTRAELREIEHGPFQGVYTTENIRSSIYDYLEDIDTIDTLPGEKVYLNNANPMGFLCLDKTTTNHFLYPSATLFSRHLRFFAEHPEMQPDIIYLSYDYELYRSPFNVSAREGTSVLRDFAHTICEEKHAGTYFEGNKGIIINLQDWNYLSQDTTIEWITQIERGEVLDG